MRTTGFSVLVTDEPIPEVFKPMLRSAPVLTIATAH